MSKRGPGVAQAPVRPARTRLLPTGSTRKPETGHVGISGSGRFLKIVLNERVSECMRHAGGSVDGD